MDRNNWLLISGMGCLRPHSTSGRAGTDIILTVQMGTKANALPRFIQEVFGGGDWSPGPQLAPWSPDHHHPAAPFLLFATADCAAANTSALLLPGVHAAVLLRVRAPVTSASGILPLTSNVHSLNCTARAFFRISVTWDLILSTCSLCSRFLFTSDFILASL